MVVRKWFWDFYFFFAGGRAALLGGGAAGARIYEDRGDETPHCARLPATVGVSPELPRSLRGEEIGSDS